MLTSRGPIFWLCPRACERAGHACTVQAKSNDPPINARALTFNIDIGSRLLLSVFQQGARSRALRKLPQALARSLQQQQRPDEGDSGSWQGKATNLGERDPPLCQVL